MNHLINTLIFDLTIKNKEDNFRFQEKVSSLIKEKVIPLLENIFNKAVGVDETIIIDQLTLDLNTLSIKLLDDELIIKIEQCLSSILEDEVEGMRNQTLQDELLKNKLVYHLSNMFQPGTSKDLNDDINQILTDKERITSLFLYYIYRGYFPWWADGSVHNNFDLHILSLAENKPEIFSWIIKDIIIRKNLLSLIRVINYFEDKFLDIFIRNTGVGLLNQTIEHYLPSSIGSNNMSGKIYISKREKHWITTLLNELRPDFASLASNNKKVESNNIQKYFPHTMIFTGDVSEKEFQSNKNSTKMGPETSTLEHEKTPVYNCGLVLTGVFLQSFFSRLSLLENSQFISQEHKNKAVYLLQYLVTGIDYTPEYELTLNKVLCGMDITWPLQRTTITREEKNEADNLLISMIKHWKELKNTSIDGFRNSFLKRPGILESKDGFWEVRAEGKSYDLLLDTLPWTISVINLPWLTKPVHVEWQ